MTRLLLLHTSWDEEYLDKFQRLESMQGVQVKRSAAPTINPVVIDAACNKIGADAVVITQQPALESILRDTPDWIAPSTNKKITLDDYAGSILRLRSGREVLVCNPFERLYTVPYERFILNRYISKLTRKNKWFPQTAFKWGKVTLDNRYEILRKIENATLVGIDIENPYPQVELRIITCVSYTIYDAATHTTESWVVGFDEGWQWDFIKAANATKSRKVFQNGLHDNTYFLRWGAPVRNWLFDTFHLFHSWLAELPKRLDFVTAFCVRDVRYWKDDGTTGKPDDLWRYCCMDSWATVNAWLALVQEVPEWAIENYTKHEFPMVFPSLHAACEGLEVDREEFDRIAAEKEEERVGLQTRLQYLLSTPAYNPNSSKQNKKLFELLGCGHLEGTGKIPTMRAKFAHPLNNLVLTMVEEYKKQFKQVGTYFDADKLWDNRIYYAINPGGTDTLRAASYESSWDCGWQIQNIPRDDPSFKKCVLAPPGWFIGEADKKQSEARCVAYLSGDMALINLVESKHDYHAWNASEFFGIKYELIFDEETGDVLMKEIRDLSKRTNHGANYNMGADVMLDTMGPAKVAKAKITLKLPKYMTLRQVCGYLLDRYEKTYVHVKGRWYESIVQAIETTKKLVSPLGWTRLFHGSPRHNKQHLNSAVAHSPQNLSVGIINKEWYKIWRETVYGILRGRVRIKAQIHDSLLFIFRELTDAHKVAEMMDTRVNVTGSDGVTREMFIPCDLSTGKKGLTRRWSEIK